MYYCLEQSKNTMLVCKVLPGLNDLSKVIIIMLNIKLCHPFYPSFAKLCL